jgi:hypothetical protein
LDENFAQIIGEFLGYFLRKPHFKFLHALDVNLLRFRICCVVDFFEFENGFDILALNKTSATFWGKIRKIPNVTCYLDIKSLKQLSNNTQFSK